METSALDSTNVEAAFNEVLMGKKQQNTHPHIDLCVLTVSCADLKCLSLFVSAIHSKVARREVTLGSISAVTLSIPIGPASEAEGELKSCCSRS